MAVYTQLQYEAIKDFLLEYGIEERFHAAPIPEGIQNTNYRILLSTRSLILTVFEDYTPKNDLPTFMQLMQHMARSGVACPNPLMRADKQVLGSLAGKPAALFPLLPGRPAKEVLRHHCQEVGRLLAKIHLAGQDFAPQRPNQYGLSWCLQQVGEMSEHIPDHLAHELYFLAEYDLTSLPHGWIHADLFQDNVLFRDTQLTGVIDFYFASQDIYIWDLAIAINAWCFPNSDIFDEDQAFYMLDAYERVRPLHYAEKEMLPLMLRATAIRFYLSRLWDLMYRPGYDGDDKDPEEYYKKLQCHLESGWNYGA